MNEIKDINWFKNNFAPKLEGYELIYKFFNEGDLGSLNQVEFDSKKKVGNIEFWGLGYIGILVYGYVEEEVLMNVLLKPHQDMEKEEALKQLEELLKETD